MGLLVRAHLQTVLDEPQEIVSSSQFIACGRAYPAASRQRHKRRHRAAVAQYIVPAAGNQLLGLHEKLDLANTAATHFDVVPLYGNFAVTAVDVDLLLHRMHVGDGSEIQIFAPDEGRKLAYEFGAGIEVAGAGARLDQRRTLPGLASAFVIVERRVGRYRNLGRRRIGPQTQIDPENVAIGGPLLQELDQISCEPGKKRRRLYSVCQCRDGRIEKHHEVNIAGIVQLMGAHLPHGQHHVTGGDFGIFLIGQADLPALGGLGEQVIGLRHGARYRQRR